ncbi:MAG TPA: adenylate/guanylate cyclase domain-containing protein [Gemmataceae bacterium]|nr:adenylate/guanylate cyclase domain-containing protein [Gemmataceae bacterium]
MEGADEYGVQALEGQTLAPGSLAELSRRVQPLPGFQGPQLDDLVGWLQTTIGVLQSTVGAADFLEKAAEALVQIIGLDAGRVLLLQEEKWNVASSYASAAPENGGWLPSRHVLGRLRQEKRTMWQRPQEAVTDAEPSLRGLSLVVASPLLDAQGQVIGALYGECRTAERASRETVKLQAALVEVLACGLAAGLARQEQQLAALKARVQFEQFFTPQLAEQLRQQPDLLEGREVEVTLLFCDIRGFSRISERLGPRATMHWIGDVMGALSERVLEQEGVLVDTIGDELIGMWGAPRPQADHALRAVSAALAMQAAVRELDERWRPEVGEPLSVGIGLNTGVAQVGNTGSRHKFKYGALGNTVNLASRVQGLTKYLKCPLLVTGATRRRLDRRFVVRRVCKARVVNIAEPVDLHEIELASGPERENFFALSQAALEALEAGEYALAARQAGALLQVHAGDGPLLLVLVRATQMLMQGGAFDPVWEPPGK